jgi:hypothetical protein
MSIEIKLDPWRRFDGHEHEFDYDLDPEGTAFAVRECHVCGVSVEQALQDLETSMFTLVDFTSVQ